MHAVANKNALKQLLQQKSQKVLHWAHRNQPLKYAKLLGSITDTAWCASQVVGHTIQEQGINSACAEQVFRIDVGMSKGCGNGEPEVRVDDSAGLAKLDNTCCQQSPLRSDNLLVIALLHS